MGKRPIELYVRSQAVALYQLDLKLSKILRQLQVPRYRVHSTVIKFDDIKRSGGPKSPFDRQACELKRLVHGDNRLSAAKIITDLNMSVSKPGYKHTMR